MLDNRHHFSKLYIKKASKYSMSFADPVDLFRRIHKLNTEVAKYQAEKEAAETKRAQSLDELKAEKEAVETEYKAKLEAAQQERNEALAQVDQLQRDVKRLEEQNQNLLAIPYASEDDCRFPSFPQSSFLQGGSIASSSAAPSTAGNVLDEVLQPPSPAPPPVDYSRFEEASSEGARPADTAPQQRWLEGTENGIRVDDFAIDQLSPAPSAAAPAPSPAAEPSAFRGLLGLFR